MHITKKENNKKEFNISESGLYAISISASCKSGRFFGLWGREDLRVEIDDIKLREIPAEKNSQYYNIPPAWNGSRLKGLTKTIIFLLNLKEGDHIIKFFSKNTATLEKDPEIIKIEDPNNIKLNLNQQAQNGSRRPWITLALIDLPLRILDASIKCEKRFLDSDDVKLIINGKIKQNKNSSRWGKNWHWQGRKMKGGNPPAGGENRFYLDLEKSNHYIEFWADRMPTINNLWVYLGIFKEEDKKEICDNIKCNDPEKNSEEFNEKYVIKDKNFNDKDALNEEEIQNFLEKNNVKNSKDHLAELIFEEQKASYWIKKAAEENAVNPKIILVKLQAEQRLIKGDKSIKPTSFQLNGAMGAGMLDDGTVISEMQGFIKQINYAAKYFRKFYDEAEEFNFIHKNVDGEELKTVNAATYSLYRYTPHIAGPKLVYDVYKMFFGEDDLGGSFNEDKKDGNIRIKILYIAALSIILILLSWIIYNFNKPIFSYDNKIDLENKAEIIVELKIFSEKNAINSDDLYCGFRAGKIYESAARLFLIYDGKIADSAVLTNPELLIGDFSKLNTNYYNPHDINGDEKKQEFIILEYSSCNNNKASFIKASKDLKKFEKIPIINKDGDEAEFVYVDVAEDSIKIDNGKVKFKFYDIETGNFITNLYVFDESKQKLVWKEFD